MNSNSNNPAAVQGWVKSTDPQTGRVFYANHVTRKTQWDPPDNWVESAAPAAPVAASFAQQQQQQQQDEDDTPLPGNWEVMHDPTTGKPFYVDHERKITQWTRPKPVEAKTTSSLRPAVATPPTSGNYKTSSRAVSFHPTATTHRTYQQEATYYTQPKHYHQSDVDLSDSLPTLDFKVQTVADKYRANCPHCDALFTVSKRRHHCRLCGDVFCDACSSHRCQLPLQGPEFEKPVRVCDFCYQDVDKGNFFSMRRYLTVLHLYDPDNKDKDDDDDGVATPSNVNAALSGLTQDLDQMVQNAVALEDKLTIPSDILVPEIIKHMQNHETSDRATCCLASLLSLENFANRHDYTVAVYEEPRALNRLLLVLERSGTDRRTLFVQEQAARTLFYLSEAKTIQLALEEQVGGDEAAMMAPVGTSGVEQALDIPRSIRNMLDHASSTGNPNLQRWAAATLKNLIGEDQRRACMAVNQMAMAAASGDRPDVAACYQSHLPELISSGGVMILGSLIGADDADTRAHAVVALGATLTSTRAVDNAYSALAEMTGGEFGKYERNQDGEIVRAIVAAGGCAGSVAQLLLSAENNVAGMGCGFLSSLVRPLLEIASGTLPSTYDYRQDTSNLGACREAAIEIATGSCLPALLSLVRDDSRPLDLRWIAMETLTAAVVSIGEMGRSWAYGNYEEGLEKHGAPNKLKESIVLLNEEGVLDTALSVLQSSLGQSLGTDSKETPAARIRECAGMLLSALTSCSAEAIMELQNKNILSALLLASADSTVTASTLRGDGSPRCLGVLETVAALLMFAWQHPSGSEKDLLDTLIEMIDAGAIPYVSKVMGSKVEWDSNDKAVGGMKGRAASCRLLCCLFGIALTDSTGIGMRRLMDAVDADARSYRPSPQGKRLPSNIIESALGSLQTAATLARKVMVGGAGASQQGAHYQSTLMDLVEASLLASGSMCGSSIAPGGSEGTLITGRSFLEGRTDPYVSKRQEICNVTCDVVVRGGRGGPAFLPAMVVGGFGEGSVLASLRLALAIAQNGTNEQHAKLAMSGILVPISDLLRSALSSGDIYKFSSSLALVRFCGPHVAAGQGGGVESVRDAIRVATNVLTLPVNPDASLKQMETQETLKSECVSALESLSQNASLWSSISTDALPSIVRYLHSSSEGAAAANPRNEATRCAALRAVLQIVQVPSHAVSAAEAGIVQPLGSILSAGKSTGEEDEVPMLALEVLHVIAKNQQARQKARLLETGLVRAICSALGKCATDTPKQPSDSRADVTFLGLEILLFVRSDIEGDYSFDQLLQSPAIVAFLDSVASEPQFVRALCSAMLLTTKMKLPRHDADTSGEVEFSIPKLYGPPLLYVPEACGGYDSTHNAAEALLFSVAVYACALENPKSDSFWSTALLQSNMPRGADTTECLQTSATLVAHFLAQLTNDHKPFIPRNSQRQGEYLTITRPLVRHRLLDALKDSMSELSGDGGYGPNADPYVTSLLVAFNVPHICLSLWRDPALLDIAFELIKQIVEQDPDEVLHLFVEGKPAIMSLFDLLNLDSAFESSTNVTDIRGFLASVLGQLAENGLLTDAVERYDVRSSAIAALAAACLNEQERPPDEDEDMTSTRLSTVLMKCLVELCTVKGKGHKEEKTIRLASAEAAAIAKNLGRKICHMVLSRFLERSKLQQYEMEEDENIMDAPDVAMLCAVAQHDEALQTLRSIGGLHALSLVAAEGEITALEALQKACSGDASVLLEGDTYMAMMGLICSEEHDATWRAESPTWRRLETSAFELLASLCSGSAKGRAAVAGADTCGGCISRAIEIVSAIAGTSAPTEAEADTSVESDEECNVENAAPVDNEEPTREETADKMPKPAINGESIQLVSAACAFLSSLVKTKIAREKLRDSTECIEALSLLSTNSESDELLYSALEMLVALTPYASTDGPIHADRIGEVLKSVLGSPRKIKTTGTLNSNRVHCSAVNGLLVVFDLLPEEIQKSEAAAVVSLFGKSVKNCVVARSTTRDEDRAHSAELSYALSSFLLLVRGTTFFNELIRNEHVVSMLHLLQWRQDPKTSLGRTNTKAWDASVANVLLLLSTVLWRPEETLTASGIDLQSIAGTTLMLARPGKAPRKAIDVKSTLVRFAEGPDAASSVAAQRILERLF